MGLATNGIMSGVSRGVLLASRGLTGYFPMLNGIAFSDPSIAGFIVPKNVHTISIEAWGGGASGQSTGGAYGGDGGGSGAYCKRNAKTVSINEKVNVVIGSGGAAVAAGVLNGNNGGATSVDGMNAGGGIAPTSVSFGTPAAGGTASGGDVNTSGGAGGVHASQFGNPIPGAGGNAPNGGLGGDIGSTVPNNGFIPGGGGSGAAVQSGVTVSGAGANGGVVFRWSEEILDDFETFSSGLPIGGLVWTALSGGTIYTSTDMVRHGAANAYFSGSGAGVGIVSNVVDLYRYKNIKIDVQMYDPEPFGFKLRVYDANGTSVQATMTGQTITTLNVDITSLDRSTARIELTFTNGGPAQVDFLRGVLDRELLDGFEGGVFSYLTENYNYGGSYSASLSNVTQGSNSMYLDLTGSNGYSAPIKDLGPFSSIKLDVKPITGSIRLAILADTNNSLLGYVTSSGTTQQTLTLDLASIAKRRSCRVAVFTNSGFTGYIDNLRGIY